MKRVVEHELLLRHLYLLLQRFPIFISRRTANSLVNVSNDFPYDRSYAGMPISEVFSADIGLGGVLSLLWFRRRLPDYATKFIEMILMVSYHIQYMVSISKPHRTDVSFCLMY